MVSGNSPYRVYNAPIVCLLEQQNTGAFLIVRILLNYLRGSHSLDNFPGG